MDFSAMKWIGLGIAVLEWCASIATLAAEGYLWVVNQRRFTPILLFYTILTAVGLIYLTAVIILLG